ncbi:MAG: tetratricopeptide repeat protein, partial [Planctomycetaceae bacterium]|nr:tetratricopeptide repeat protein [Planctomycetaceae bacterium]
NTGIAWLKDLPDVVKIHEEFLKDSLRVDIFGIKEEGTINGKLHAPLRPEVPTLVPGRKYLLEAVLRTLKLGHLFSQGTVDSNEIWLDVTVKSGEKVIGRSGGIEENTEVDKWSHFVNVFMLDREGNRINRRNPQDIFVPLYNNQIPPGAAHTIHYELQLPQKLDAPLTIEVKLQYRKFDQEYMEFVTNKAQEGDNPIRGHEKGKAYKNELPIVTICTDRITLPVEGVAATIEQPKMEIPVWQRWNDYGIGLFLKGKAELRQAEEAFKEVEKLNRFDGPINLARVYYLEGRLDEMVEVLGRAVSAKDPPAPPWTLNWLTGQANREQGHLVEAEKNFRKVLEDKTPEMIEKGFDFSLDIEVINLLGLTQFDMAKQARGDEQAAERKDLLLRSVDTFKKTLLIDSENISAHYNLHLLYTQLGEKQ